MQLSEATFHIHAQVGDAPAEVVKQARHVGAQVGEFGQVFRMQVLVFRLRVFRNGVEADFYGGDFPPRLRVARLQGGDLFRVVCCHGVSPRLCGLGCLSK